MSVLRESIAAVVQMSSGSDQERNFSRAEQLIREGAERGATFVATPENTNYLGPQARKVSTAEPLAGPVCRGFGELARELGIHLLLGSFNEQAPETGRCFNTSVLFGPEGDRVAVYRKIHLFDVDVSEKVRFKESDTVRAGTGVVVARTTLGNVGMSICFDLRFPELYRRMVEEGAEILTVPSAFTATTGEAHWEILLRARAIESQCYLLAPAQWGRHDDEGIRESFGNSMIVDPWGRVLARIAQGEGLAVAKLDPSLVRETRRSIPVGSSRGRRTVEGI